MCQQYVQCGFSYKLTFADKLLALIKLKKKLKRNLISTRWMWVNATLTTIFFCNHLLPSPRALALNDLSYTWCRMAGFCQGHRDTKWCFGCEMSSRMPTTASGWCHMSTTGLDAARFFNECVMCMLQMTKKRMDLPTEKRFGQIQQRDEVMQYLQVKSTLKQRNKNNNNSLIQIHPRIKAILIFIHIHQLHIKRSNNNKHTNKKNKTNLPSALMKYKDTAKSSRSAVQRRMFSPKSALNKRN